MSKHKKGLMLIAASTETKRFKEFIWNKAHSILFMDHRPTFFNSEGVRGKTNCGQSMCIVSYTPEDTEYLKRSGLGITIEITSQT